MENEKLELKEGTIWLNQDIRKALQEVYDHYRSILSRNEYLEEENKRLKSEAYKEEELSTMKAKYDKMYQDYFRGFPISEEEEEKINKWKQEIMEKYPADDGAIGGRFTYKFTPTSLGTIGSIVDGFSKERFEFKEDF
jgi:hypothetical protein